MSTSSTSSFVTTALNALQERLAQSKYTRVFLTPRLWVILLTGMVMLPLMAKILFVENFLMRMTNTRFHGGIQALGHDAILYASILTTLYISLLKATPRLIAMGLRGLAFLALTIYTVDMIVLKDFTSHLTIHDTLQYGAYAHKYIGQVISLKGIVAMPFILLLIGAVFYCVWMPYRIQSAQIHRTVWVGITALMACSFLASGEQYTHSWVYKNVVSYNFEIRSAARAYSPGFVSQLEFNPGTTTHQLKAPNKKNVILLMVESLSSYQSDYFSGIRNWTPNLDKIAKSNRSYMQFYANGFKTEDGEIALLTGLLPIYAPEGINGPIKAFDGFYDVQNSLPRVLRQQGYQTDFLTTADLSFSKTGPWAQSTGFDYVEGHEHPDYDNWDRMQFNAAPDEALYQRVMARTRDHGNASYFIFIKTATTHHPFYHPETKTRSEEASFKYADKHLGLFYKQLEDANFFDNGLLIILGDHHAMVPFKKGEQEILGRYRASARTPMIIADGGKTPQVIEEAYQQIDVCNGLMHLATDQLVYTDWIGDIFEHKPAKFIAHRRADYRDRISVFSKDHHYLVKMDGDKTRMTTEADVDDEMVVGKINYERVSRL